MLGLDTAILNTLESKERRAYKIAAFLFYGIVALIVIGDAYAGYFFEGTWLAVFVSLAIFGFIHFSVYRLAMITLTTRPLSHEINVSEAGLIFRKFKIPFSWDFAIFFRAIFVGCISLSLAVLLTLAIQYKTVEVLNFEYRNEVFNSNNSGSLGDFQLDENTRFPFIVFKALSHNIGFKFSVLFLFIILQSPLIFLSYLRRSPKFQYTKMLTAIHRQAILDSYRNNLNSAQTELNKRFPGRYNLEEMSVYLDPPFNTKFKKEHSEEGTSVELNDFLNSI